MVMTRLRFLKQRLKTLVSISLMVFITLTFFMEQCHKGKCVNPIERKIKYFSEKIQLEKSNFFNYKVSHSDESSVKKIIFDVSTDFVNLLSLYIYFIWILALNKYFCV